ncbi:MAG: 1-deoxy-D-xylulose-5-phosphate reductoisomerase [Muribaculaceae bacterium]|nr:1-deoxy-D-xylulose-5-phosphate reductoisomerase [Muribaculaceae bacterium]
MTNQKKIAILGSTGSIGAQTLEVIAQYPELFKATVLIAGTRVDTLIQQAIKFLPEWAIIADTSLYWKLRDALEPLGIKTAAGQDAINDSMNLDCFDTVVTATVGYSGLTPTLRAIKASKKIALANKETLVVAGDIVCKALEQSPSTMLPVDSEHSAIYQCLVGESPERVRRIIITASGGPFRKLTPQQIEEVTVRDALHHPNWQMGAKITIDSATMLNKAFEIIEARWLFNMRPDQIEPIVHPQSVVHSMVEFMDGAVKAQLGIPDMKLPIRYALGETFRLDAPEEHLDFDRYGTLTFEKPDEKKFPCITLAAHALTRGGNTACVINAANEIAVKAFLNEKIKFTQIYPLITETLAQIQFIASPTYDDYVACNAESRAKASEIAEKLSFNK